MLGEIIEFAVGFGLEAARESSLKDNFIPLAVEIARHQGWVSPHRMSNQAGLSRRDAQIVLFAACNRGFLYRAVNGRFYPSDIASPASTIAFEPLPYVQIDRDADQPSSGSNPAAPGKGVFVFVLLVAASLIAVFLFSGRREPARVWQVPTADLPVPEAATASVPAWQSPTSQAIQPEPLPAPMKLLPAISSPTAPRAPKKHRHSQQAPKRQAGEPMPGERY
jgi:hypothetical protein